jgi:hypothetical protein
VLHSGDGTWTFAPTDFVVSAFIFRPIFLVASNFLVLVIFEFCRTKAVLTLSMCLQGVRETVMHFGRRVLEEGGVWVRNEEQVRGG